MIKTGAIVIDSMVWNTIFMIIGIVVACYLIYVVYIDITRRMARKRHRDPLGWVLLSLFVSPLLSWIILLIVGDNES